ncbi:transporter substrate-binding domain-containing protein [Bacterioplanes sanyensis]|nr:transporter substrate-binding domain-containing protein [Bacterioplanes sanyensis]
MMLRSSVMLMLLLPIVAAAQTLSIRSDTWYPMNGDPQADKPGFMIEIAKAIFEPQGITIDYRLMPWERALSEVRAGRIDCVVGAYVEDAPDFVFPEQPWGLIMLFSLCVQVMIGVTTAI